VSYVKEKRKITNKEYLELFVVSRESASLDLAKLAEKGFFENSGSKGAGSLKQTSPIRHSYFS
jgi:predicted HTH transcriptional regulator